MHTTPKVAIVGTRKPFGYTKELTHHIASMVTNRGGVVISGLAMGVDAIAHKAAPNRTIAILGNGLDRIYPSVNKDLFLAIKEEGLILSEYGVKTPSLPHQFIERNRLVVALSDIVIIAQADRNSGSLHSARFAQELGKPLFVLPHRLGESLGTHDLLVSKKASSIEDCDEFASMYLPLMMDATRELIRRTLSLEEAYSLYKEELYEWELMGKVTIENGKVSFYD
jgi:DNA processing protein